MIANLITTIMVALGVATGNVSSNVYKGGNAFNHEITQHEEKPKIKSQNTQYTYNETLGVTEISAYYGPYTQQPYREYVYTKYYLYEANSGQEANVNITLPNMIINNTIYTFEETGSNNERILNQYYVLNLNNIYPGTNEFTTKITNTSSVQVSYQAYVWETTDETALQMLDITMTQNAQNNFENILFNTIEKTQIYYTSGNATTNGTSYNYTTSIQTPVITLQEDEIKTIIIRTRNQAVNVRQLVVQYQDLTIDANFIAPVVNYEIVDIPNLMYTILTMPFSFYSTAFNLTIFPNTPYQVNFGNLILTILGALILFYLIKKVIK